MDYLGNIKIGDFGLATSLSRGKNHENGELISSTSDLLDDENKTQGLLVNQLCGDDISISAGGVSGVDFSRYAIDRDTSTMGDGSTAQYAVDSLTGGVGTALYSAPEQAVTRKYSSAAGLSYDSKADMFSLGVILFEMSWKPFSTGMTIITYFLDIFFTYI